jgi:cyclopropane-fatty-acyl-phospholipid synthase
LEGLSALELRADMSWFDKRCRAMVFKTLKALQQGTLLIVEGNNVNHFGAPLNCDDADSDEQSLVAKFVVHDVTLYKDLVLGGSIGFAQAYIAQKWSSTDLTAVIRIFAKAQQLTDKLERGNSWISRIQNALAHRANKNSIDGSKNNIAAHYDLGNELYTRFLDPKMMYSAGIYPDENASLEQAQTHKLETICQRLELTSSDHLLEIGTGWGGLAIYAAQHYGCKVTTTTISQEQHKYVADLVEKLGLTDQITLLKKDYRELTGEYDKLVSIEMIEAVGYDYLESFFTQCNQRLKSGGKMLLQSITIADQRFDHYRTNVDFIQRFVFPGGFLPSITEITKRTTVHTDMVVEALHDIGLDYAKTLAHWRDNFLASWHELKTLGYDEHFKRLWLYYLAYCEGAFLERATSTVHVVMRRA